MGRNVTNNTIIDDYTLEAEIQDENAPCPVRWIATNTDDKSTAEASLSFERSSDLLNSVYREHAASQMEILRSHGYFKLVSQEGVTTRCILNSAYLVPFGFSRDELRPWRIETVAEGAR